MTAPRFTNAEVATQRRFFFDGAILVTPGDLLFYTGDDVKPTVTRNAALVASAALCFPDLLTEDKNQRKFARHFAGVAKDHRGINDPLPAGGAVQLFTVATDVDGEYDCISDTFEVNDMVAVCEYTAGALAGVALEPQKLKKTTDPSCAIGYVTIRHASATTRIAVRLISNVTAHEVAKFLPLRGLANTQILAGDLVLTEGDASVQLLDNGAAPRNVDLPAVQEGLSFWITNTGGGANSLTVRLANAGATVATLKQNTTAIVYCDGVNWVCMAGAQVTAA